MLRQRKITGVSEKFPEQKVEFMEPKAPVIETKKPIIKKLTGKKVGLEEESEIEGEMIPVVGEQGLEMVSGEEELETEQMKPKPRRDPVKRVK